MNYNTYLYIYMYNNLLSIFVTIEMAVKLHRLQKEKNLAVYNHNRKYSLAENVHVYLLQLLCV